MKRYFLFLIATPLLWASIGDPIPGFEDPILMEKIMTGTLEITRPIETTLESKAVVKSFFKQVSPDSYIDLTVNYPKYKDLFSEVKSGKQLSVNADKTIYTYLLHIMVKVGVMNYEVDAEGQHQITYAPSVHEETKVFNQMTNLKENLEFARQWVRLIPFENGMLVEDIIHVKGKDTSLMSKTAKKKLLEFFMGYTPKVRTELGGNP